jgi:hypothetical protein
MAQVRIFTTPVSRFRVWIEPAQGVPLTRSIARLRVSRPNTSSFLEDTSSNKLGRIYKRFIFKVLSLGVGAGAATEMMPEWIKHCSGKPLQGQGK